MSPKLFTASDVQRAARLAATAARSGDDVERCVAYAADMIVDEGPHYFTEHDVLHILQYLLQKEDVEAEFADAVATALRR